METAIWMIIDYSIPAYSMDMSDIWKICTDHWLQTVKSQKNHGTIGSTSETS